MIVFNGSRHLGNNGHMGAPSRLGHRGFALLCAGIMGLAPILLGHSAAHAAPKTDPKQPKKHGSHSPRKPVPAGATKEVPADNHPRLALDIPPSPQTGVIIDTLAGTPVVIIPPGANGELRMVTFGPHHTGIYAGNNRDVYVIPRGNGLVDFTLVLKSGAVPANEIFVLAIPDVLSVEPSGKTVYVNGLPSDAKGDQPARVAEFTNFYARGGSGGSIPVRPVIAGNSPDGPKLMLKIGLPPNKISFPITETFSYRTLFSEPKPFTGHGGSSKSGGSSSKKSSGDARSGHKPISSQNGPVAGGSTSQNSSADGTTSTGNEPQAGGSTSLGGH